jgi:hypothetical protein
VITPRHDRIDLAQIGSMNMPVMSLNRSERVVTRPKRRWCTILGGAVTEASHKRPLVSSVESLRKTGSSPVTA